MHISISLLAARNVVGAILMLSAITVDVDAQTSVEFWKPSTGPFAGPVRQLAQLGNGRIVATTFHGIYLSDSDGARWRLTNNALGDSNMFALATSPEGTIVAGLLSGGLTRSTDAGETWSMLAPMPSAVLTLTFARDGSLYAGTRDTLMRSTDAGLSWRSVDTLTRIGSLNSVAGGGGSELLFAGRQSSVYRSSDGGVTWSRFATPLSEGWLTAVARAADGSLLANFREYTQSNNYRSTDDGATWTQIELDGWPPSAFLVADNVLLFGTIGGVRRSTDRGATWESAYRGPFHGFSITEFLMTRAGTVLGATPDGVYRSDDLGVSWLESSNGILSGRGNAIVARPNGDLMADVGELFYRSSDLGDTWRRTAIRSMAHDATVLSDGRLVVLQNEGIFTNDDGGETFTMAHWRGYHRAHRITRVDDSTLVAVNRILDEIHRSTDRGASWNRVKDIRIYNPHDVVGRPDGTVYLSAYDGIWRSTDRGATWDTLTTGLHTLSGPYAITHSADGSILVGSAGGLLHRITLSSGAADRSERIGSGLGSITDILSTPEGVIYVATQDSAAWRTLDGGATWERLLADRPTQHIHAFLLHPSGYLFANTAGGSVLRSLELVSLPTIVEGEEALPLEMDLSEAMPPR